MIPISLTTHAQDYCCLPACHVCLNGRAALYSHPSFVRPSFKEIISYSPKLNSLDCSSFKNGSLMID